MAVAVKDLGEIILFEHPNFRGAHRHVFQREDDLNATDASVKGTVGPALGQFNEKTSSIVVVKGTWILFENKGCAKRIGEVGPGRYDNVAVDLEITGNTISSLKPKEPSP
jgi:hypothetical protein